MENMQMIDEEISLLDIFKFFIKYKTLILVVTIITFLIGFFLSTKRQKFSYTAESGIAIVWPKFEVLLESKIFIKDIGDILFQQFENRKRSVQELLVSETVLTPIIEKAESDGLIKKGELTYLDFIKKDAKIIEVISSGEIIKFRVTMIKPELSKLFAQEIAKNAVEKIQEVMSKNDDLATKMFKQKENFSVKIAYIGEPKEVLVESKKKFLVISLIAGIIIGIFLSLINEAYQKVKGQL